MDTKMHLYKTVLRRLSHSTIAQRGRVWSGLAVCATLAIVLSGCAFSVPMPADNDNQGDASAREIEEADIIKLQDGYFYVANPYTGLRIVDATTVDAPEMRGAVALGGRAVELFVRDGLAFVFTAADFVNCAGSPVGFEEGQFDDQRTPDYEGSRLWVVDVADADAPIVVNTFDFEGFVTGTRRVGDVIYVAGNAESRIDEDGQYIYDDIWYQRTTDVFVTSINIADETTIATVDTETFTGTSQDIHVSTEAMYVLGADLSGGQITTVSYVDISDESGDIVVRDQFRVPGTIENRFYVDDYDDTFRIITEEWIDAVWAEVVALYTYDVSNPDDVTRLARETIITDESLRAVRFDGPRGYAVTFMQIDPLFVLDLSDPTDPQVTGELEVPGYSTHLVPLGTRLIGVGFDDTDGVRPAVALYDVEDPTNPQQLDRITVGEEGTWRTGSLATVDEKALRVIEDAGLILLPFSTFDDEEGVFIDRLQLIGLGTSDLKRRGTVDHQGQVTRADLLDERLWVLSDQAFQTVDIDDLSNPSTLATLEFITEQELLDAGFWNCVTNARYEATRVSFGLNPWRGSFCGVVGVVPMIAMFTGLGLLRIRRRVR